MPKSQGDKQILLISVFHRNVAVGSPWARRNLSLRKAHVECGRREREYMVSVKIFKGTEPSVQCANVAVSQFEISQNKKFLETEGGG